MFVDNNFQSERKKKNVRIDTKWMGGGREQRVKIGRQNEYEAEFYICIGWKTSIKAKRVLAGMIAHRYNGVGVGTAAVITAWNFVIFQYCTSAFNMGKEKAAWRLRGGIQADIKSILLKIVKVTCQDGLKTGFTSFWVSKVIFATSGRFE